MGMDLKNNTYSVAILDNTGTLLFLINAMSNPSNTAKNMDATAMDTSSGVYSIMDTKESFIYIKLLLI
ncbi:hypothetical protein CLOSBL3_20445 [Clostridiaceae bacterium BL-3]|nr:hypothetical protein CLOSBL3_20445 [Clostridiaceae bacterium BL-3]